MYPLADAPGIVKGTGVTVDGQGGVYVTGTARTVNMTFFNADGTSPTGAFVSNLDTDGSFIAAYNTAGVRQWNTRIDKAAASSIDARNGRLYVTSRAVGSPTLVYNTGSSTSSASIANGGNAAMASAWTQAGQHQWTALIDGGLTATGIDADNQGNVYFTGTYSGTPTRRNAGGTAAGTLTAATGNAVFLASLTPSGTFAWSATLDAPGADTADSLALDPINNALFVSGSFAGGAMTLGQSAAVTTPPTTASAIGTSGAYVARYSTAGRLLVSFVQDGASADEANSVAIARDGRTVFVAGQLGAITTAAQPFFAGSGNPVGFGLTTSNLAAYIGSYIVGGASVSLS